jgi:serine/threonine protein kinase/Tol biopolymer transport system component
MPLAAASRFGPYEIASMIGFGAMGEVYEARDVRLGRRVALKILPAVFSMHPDRVERFEQEARAASMLNHPNIVSIYDVGRQGEHSYIVSELLEGETLRSRLQRGAVPVRTAVEYTLQIARGLAAAHAKGIVHRDLKPDNLFITREGLVKILDFGLAKVTAPDFDSGTGAAVPTIPGTVIGSAPYMAPEQVRGQPVDRRADIFALGAILYEMLSGRRAFDAASAVETMSAVLKEDTPDLSVSNPAVPPDLDRIVRHCLEKDPERRFQAAADVAFHLEGFSAWSGTARRPAVTVSRGFTLRERLFAAVAGLAVLTVGIIAVAYFRQGRERAPVIRYNIPPPEGTTLPAFPSFLTLSPDGAHLAFVAVSADSIRQLWIRDLSALTSRALAGTTGVDQPFWSPDSRFVAFFAEGKLRKVDITGGPPQTICDAPPARSGSWNDDGVIVFTPGAGAGLYTVPATGGVPAPLTTLDRSRAESDHLWPAFLPDGKRFVYLARSADPRKTALYLGSLDGKTHEMLTAVDSNAVFSPPGYLIYQHEGTLTARPFDVSRGRFTGPEFSIAAPVGYNNANGRGAFAVSQTGVLTYRAGPDDAATESVWFDRTGKRIGSLGLSDVSPDAWLSADGTALAFSRADRRTATSIWFASTENSRLTRFTFGPGMDLLPVWSSDAKFVVFASNRAGAFDLYRKVSTGTGEEQILLKSNVDKYPSDVSRDGRLLYYAAGAQGDFDLWMLSDGKPTPLLQTKFDERNGRFSPTGRWMAYVSNETGRYEVYVVPLAPQVGGKWQISTTGGLQPRWRADEGELFYLAGDGRVMAVPIRTDRGFEHGEAHQLFQTRLDPSVLINDRNYEATADGQRFLVTTPLGTSVPITVVVNWTDLRKLN